jgi:hypothetical protein
VRVLLEVAKLIATVAVFATVMPLLMLSVVIHRGWVWLRGLKW